MRTKRLRKAILSWVFAGLLLLIEGASAQGELRTWTNPDGQEIRARLVRVEEETAVLWWQGKEVKVGLDGLSAADRAHVKKVSPFGKIEEMELKPSSVQEDWLSSHRVRSYVWTGEKYGLMVRIPFLIHVPEGAEEGERLPILVHLHGTGGIGKENLKPLFSDGDGVAKMFMEEKFQKYQSCFIMVPQSVEHSGWFANDWEIPSMIMRGVVDSVRVLERDTGLAADMERVYMSGLSMGGMGVYQGLAKFPGFFAAGIAISALETPQYFSKEGKCGPAVDCGEQGGHRQ